MFYVQDSYTCLHYNVIFVTGCTQKTGTYLSLEKNTDTPNVVVIGYTGTEACKLN